jgi:hypothetical protein
VSPRSHAHLAVLLSALVALAAACGEDDDASAEGGGTSDVVANPDAYGFQADLVHEHDSAEHGGPPPDGTTLVSGTLTCCDDDAGCLEGERCVEGACHPPLKDGECWDGSDCPGTACLSPATCPCGYNCFNTRPGTCEVPAPACCGEDAPCPVGKLCVQTVCKPFALIGQCWRDEDCMGGMVCQGVSVCPCDADCDSLDAIGICANPERP